MAYGHLADTDDALLQLFGILERMFPELIERKSINEIMYAVGYSDIQTYRDVFKKNTGMTPIEYRNKYRNKYNKEAVN